MPPAIGRNEIPRGARLSQSKNFTLADAGTKRRKSPTQRQGVTTKNVDTTQRNSDLLSFSCFIPNGPQNVNWAPSLHKSSPWHWILQAKHSNIVGRQTHARREVQSYRRWHSVLSAIRRQGSPLLRGGSTAVFQIWCANSDMDLSALSVPPQKLSSAVTQIPDTVKA